MNTKLKNMVSDLFEAAVSKSEVRSSNGEINWSLVDDDISFEWCPSSDKERVWYRDYFQELKADYLNK